MLYIRIIYVCGDDGEKSADAGVACAWGKALVVVKAGDLFAAVDNPSELVLFESRIFVVLAVEDRKDLERSAISRAKDGIAENGAGGKGVVFGSDGGAPLFAFGRTVGLHHSFGWGPEASMGSKGCKTDARIVKRGIIIWVGCGAG